MAEKDEQPELTIAEDLVVTKYKMVSEMVNDILGKVLEKCVAGENVLTICEYGDQLLIEGTSKVFKKEKEMKKGIAFPTCVSVNNCICHYSPLRSEPGIVLKDGDLVKIDMGAHIDGFPAVVAHTMVVGASLDNKVTGRKADVILAAYMAMQAALRLVKPGNQNDVVTDAVQKVAESYHCKPIEGMLSHQLKQHKIDGEKAIIQNPNESQRKEHEKCEFEVNDVFGIDVLISTGEGKGRELDHRPTIYKKKDTVYNLKMKASRQFYSEMDKKFSNMPFTLRAFEDEKKARMGVLECVKHELVEPFSVLWERDSEFVAQFKFTLLLMANGPMKITGGNFDPALYESEYSVDDPEVKALLAQSASRKANKKKKKKAEKALTENADPNQVPVEPAVAASAEP